MPRRSWICLAAAMIAGPVLISGCRRCGRSPHVGAADAGAPDAGRAVAVAAPAPGWSRKVVTEPPLGKQVDIAQIVVTYRGCAAPWTPPAGRKRTLAQARQLAQKIADRARAGADFDGLAVQYSDWPFANRKGTPGYGGHLGILTEGTTTFDAFKTVPFRLKVGEVSDPVESPYGFHIFERLPATRVSEILLTYDGSARLHAPRTKSEAEALAAQIESELASGKSFADEAFAHSDDVVSAGRGGDIGAFDAQTKLSPAIADTARRLQKGQVSAPIVGPGGLYIVERTE